MEKKLRIVIYSKQKIKYIPLVLDQQSWRPITNNDSYEKFLVCQKIRKLSLLAQIIILGTIVRFDFFLMAIKKLSINPNMNL